MADKVSFELVSPARLLMSEEVDMVVIPGAEGDFGVLPEHAPLVSSIRPGIINVYQGNDVVQRIFVAGGFAEVTPERCTVLAEEAVAIEDIEIAPVEEDLSHARDDLKDATEEAETRAVERRIAIGEAKIAAAQSR
ncbi:MAG: F0F1 ATP synthase subunit epsilon [Alphaproteobacteria bacterium]|nr:F0F1 ATP synthase subunit epsilon [Alphaproteobacteria bacterium]